MVSSAAAFLWQLRASPEPELGMSRKHRSPLWQPRDLCDNQSRDCLQLHSALASSPISLHVRLITTTVRCDCCIMFSAASVLWLGCPQKNWKLGTFIFHATGWSTKRLRFRITLVKEVKNETQQSTGPAWTSAGVVLFFTASNEKLIWGFGESWTKWLFLIKPAVPFNSFSDTQQTEICYKVTPFNADTPEGLLSACHFPVRDAGRIVFNHLAFVVGCSQNLFSFDWRKVWLLLVWLGFPTLWEHIANNVFIFWEREFELMKRHIHLWQHHNLILDLIHTGLRWGSD